MDSPEWPPLRPPAYQLESPAQLPPGEQFHLPRDSGSLVMLDAGGRIRNDSSMSVVLTTTNLCLEGPPRVEGSAGAIAPTWEYPPRIRQVHLPPGQELSFRLREARPVSEWVENSKAADQGQPGPTVIASEVIYSDPFDNGIVDNWRVELTGRPLGKS